MKFIIDNEREIEWPITDLDALFLPTIGTREALITPADIAALEAQKKIPRRRHPAEEPLEVSVMSNLARLLNPGNAARMMALNALPGALRTMALDAIMCGRTAFQIDDGTASDLIAWSGRMALDEPDMEPLAIKVSPAIEHLRSATVTLQGVLFEWAAGAAQVACSEGPSE